MVIAKSWEPVLFAPLFSVTFLYLSAAIVGYLRGGGALPRWLLRFVGWGLGDDRAVRSVAQRSMSLAWLAAFVVVQEWVAFGISLREQLAVGNGMGVVLWGAHGAFAVAWSAYLLRASAQ